MPNWPVPKRIQDSIDKFNEKREKRFPKMENINDDTVNAVNQVVEWKSQVPEPEENEISNKVTDEGILRLVSFSDYSQATCYHELGVIWLPASSIFKLELKHARFWGKYEPLAELKDKAKYSLSWEFLSISDFEYIFSKSCNNDELIRNFFTEFIADKEGLKSWIINFLNNYTGDINPYLKEVLQTIFWENFIDSWIESD